ncbi:uncharacterized protein ColSpa_09435 [Colletotrichum spaethianum]|uniref:Uncharacterized protein n=1 Tax=Colletotrichum spaethianum TaxID=700344 RepID=A0AA37PBP1_9PEZI|nr:uncharacterized protein ColSpa_09435 [Colletotrichum spaethianum]GKT49254.1 hypothetical protein ColSpa_09435 [Colletotrichum spaethianum]
MMPVLMGGVLPGPVPTAYHTDALFDDLSRQMAISQASRRLSRGSSGQRNGNAMRVAKPTSANNSPRSSSAMQARRRTVVNDGNLARRRQQPMDQVILPEYGTQSRPSRPLSWHPSTFQHQQQKMPVAQHMASYPFPPAASAYDIDSYHIYQQFPPTPAAYSCNTSPVASFSPLSLPFGTYDSSAYLPVEGWNVPQQEPPAYVSSETTGYAEPFPALPTTLPDLTPSSTSTHWQSYSMDGFPSTSPPTPETLPQAQQPQPIVPNEDTIPYQPLDEPEEEGEILVGMGLYDAPDKYDQDPQLDASRSAMSSLLGAPYRPQEGTGKGLKLEESWQPPESDDEDADQDDADGEDSD